ncbi:MAG: hypothetical protein ACE5OZ_24230 [Candidatus Heimdallarchaeota archaeon]
MPLEGMIRAGVRISTQKIVEGFQQQILQTIEKARTTKSGLERTRMLNELNEFHQEVLSTLANKVRLEQNLETVSHISRKDAANDLGTMGTIEVPVLISALVDLFQISDNWLRKGTGVIWLIKSLDWIDEIPGLKGSNFHELLQLSSLTMILSKPGFHLAMGSLPQLRYHIMKQKEENSTLIDLRDFRNMLKLSYEQVMNTIVFRFQDDLADTFRQQINFRTIMEEIDLEPKQIDNEKLANVVTNDVNSYDNYVKQMDKRERSDWRNWQLGKVITYYLYEWFVQRPLTESKNERIQYLRIVGDGAVEIHVDIIDLVNRRNIKHLLSLRKRTIPRVLNQQYLDKLAREFNEIIWNLVLDVPNNIKYAPKVSLANLRKSTTNERIGESWTWIRGDFSAPLNYITWRTVLGNKFDAATNRNGMFLTPRNATEIPPNMIRSGNYWGTPASSLPPLSPLSQSNLDVIAKIRLKLDTITEKGGRGYYGKKIRIWSVEHANSLTLQFPLIRIGMRDFNYKVAKLMRDHGVKTIDDGKIISNILIDHLEEVRKRAEPVNEFSFVKRAIAQINYWLKEFQKQFLDGLPDEGFISHLIEIGWRFGLNKALINKSSSTSILVAKLVADANGPQKEWVLWEELSLSNVADKMENRTEINKRRWILDGLQVYINKNRNEALIIGVQDKVVKKVSDINDPSLAREYHYIHDIRKLNQLLNALYKELRSHSESEKIRLGEKTLENSIVWNLEAYLTNTQRNILKKIQMLLANPEKLKIESILTVGVLRIAKISIEKACSIEKVRSLDLSIHVWQTKG